MKIDWCRALVEGLFGGDPGVTDDEKMEMVKNLLGTTKKTVDVEVLAAVAYLDTENLEAFRHLQKAAVETLESGIYGSAETAEKEFKGFSLEEAIKQAAPKVAEAKKEHEAAVTVKGLRNWGQTPEDLKTLLPGSGEIKGLFWATYNPLKQYFRVEYPIAGLLVWFHILFLFMQIYCLLFHLVTVPWQFPERISAFCPTFLCQNKMQPINANIAFKISQWRKYVVIYYFSPDFF